MRPLRVKLKGITRYTEPLDLDLSEVPPGLVAIVGGNGQGKSTIMECMAPVPLYLELPSYPVTLQDCVQADVRDAYLDVTMDYGGSTWRHLVQIDPMYSGGRGKAEAFLYRDGEPLTPGRLTDYREEVAKHFPAREVFLAAAFSVQTGTGNWFELSRVERRDLFAKLLGLSHLQELAERARETRKGADAIAAGLDRELERAGVDEHERARVQEQLQGLREMRAAEAQVAATKREASDEATAAELAAETAAETAAEEAEEARTRLQELRARQQDAQERLAKLQATAAEHQVVLEREQLTTNTADHYRELGTRLAEQQQRLAEQQQEVRQHTQREQDLQRRRRELLEEQNRLRAQLEQDTTPARIAKAEGEVLPRLRARLEELQLAGRGPNLGEARDLSSLAQSHHRELVDSRQATAREIDQATRRAELLERVPCGGQVLVTTEHLYGGTSDRVDCGTCELLTDARQASEALPELQERLQQLTARADLAARWLAGAREHVARAEAAHTARNGMQEARRELTGAEELLEDLRGRLEALGPVRDRLQALPEAVAEQDRELGTCQQQLAKAAAAVDKVQQSVDSCENRRDRMRNEAVGDDPLQDLEELRRVQAQHEQLAERLADQERLQGQLAEDLEHARKALPDEERLAELQQAARAAGELATTAHEAYSEVAEQLEGLDRQIGTAEGRLQELDRQAKRQAEVQRQRELLDRRRSGWVLLERALGRDGVQALEIDAAGPEVSELINELLIAVFGRRFSARLRTVKPASAGRKQREVFDLEILDGERGGKARPASQFSVGERTLISEALKLALAIFRARRQAVPIETLWRDECDGPLEARYAAAYPDMLRKALTLGGYRNVYLISHRREVWSQADAIIRVGGGRAELEA